MNWYEYSAKKTKNDFEKYKENVRKHRDMKLVTTKARKIVSVQNQTI